MRLQREWKYGSQRVHRRCLTSPTATITLGFFSLTQTHRATSETGLTLWRSSRQPGTGFPIRANFMDIHSFKCKTTGAPYVISRIPQLRLYNAALKVIASSNGLLFFHGVDTAKLRLAYQKPHDPHIIALQYVLERAQEYAVKHDVRINVIADQVHDQYHHEQRIKLFQQVGTMGYKRSKLERINLPFDWSDSRSHRNLQAIDLAVFIHRRKFAHVETNQLSAQQWRNSTQPSIR